MTATSSSPPGSPLSLGDLAGDPKRVAIERAVRISLTVAATTSVVISIAIIYVLFRDAFAFLGSIKLSDLNDDVWLPRGAERKQQLIDSGFALAKRMSWNVVAGERMLPAMGI